MNRLILIAAFCLTASPVGAQAWFHWDATRAIHQAAPQKAGKPPVSIRYRAHHRGQR